MESSWDTAPDSSSTYEIYKPDDQYLFGNGVDPIQKYDLSIMEDLEGNAPNGNILTVYKRRLIVAGDPSFPHRLWYSHINNAEGWSRDTDWIDVYPEDGGKVNNLGIRNDELIVGKSNGKLYGWRIFEDGNPRNSRLRTVEDDKGPVSGRAGITVEDIRHIFDRNQHFTVPRTKRGGLSYIVQEVIEAISSGSLAGLSTGNSEGKIYASIGSVTFNAGKNITVDDAVLVYDTVNEAYYLRDNMQARVFANFIDSNNEEKMYFGDANGRVFKIDEGTKAGNAPIHMVIRTKPYFMREGKNIRMRKVGVLMSEPDGTQVTARINAEEGFVRDLGTVNEEPIDWLDADGDEGPMYQLQFTHSGSDARPALFGYVFVWREQSRKDKHPHV